MVRSVNFEEELKKKTGRAEEIIRNFLPKADGFQKHLAEAMNYSMTAGGKRIRPVLMAESYQMFGGGKAVIEPFMAALEMIHTHSLIHDDLPAIDNDLFRRGRKTTHAVFGEAMGILSGDSLLNYAYETALQAFLHPDDWERTVRALKVLAEKTGLYGMLGGQSVDVENEKNETEVLNREALDAIYLHKTSALLEAALMIGAILAGADKGEVTCMEQIGAKIGLAFQIQDDILDVTSTAEELGKPVFSDEKNHKTTYVTLMGVEEASRQVQKLTDEAICLLDSLPGDKDFLRSLLLYMASRKK